MPDPFDPRATISVIVPSLDGYRGGNLARLKRDLEEQTCKPSEFLVVTGVRPNGRARNVGRRRAKGEILVFIDDDVRLGHRRVLEQLVKPFLEDPRIGMTGPSQRLPKGASPMQRQIARQLPRFQSPVVQEITDSDMVTHMCLAIPARIYDEVGGEDDHLVRGTDPDLRQRVRARGYRVVLVPRAWAYHPPPASLSQLVRLSWKNGIGSAWVYRRFPEKVLEAPGDGLPPPYALPGPLRWARRLFAVPASLLIGHPLKALSDAVYIAGYVYGLLAAPWRLEKRAF